jgi:hypothetical protein
MEGRNAHLIHIATIFFVAIDFRIVYVLLSRNKSKENSMYLTLDWPTIDPDTKLPNTKADLKQVTVYTDAESLQVVVSAVTKYGTPLEGQAKNFTLPKETYEAVAASQRETFFKVLQSLPSDFYTSQGLPDLSQAVIVYEDFENPEAPAA